MATLFYLNPRVVEISKVLSPWLPTGCAHLIAEYAWHTDRDKLIYVLRDATKENGHGLLKFDVSGVVSGNYLTKLWVRWGPHIDPNGTSSIIDEPDWEKKSYWVDSHDLWFSMSRTLSYLDPNALHWAARKKYKRLEPYDHWRAVYRNSMNALMARY